MPSPPPLSTLKVLELAGLAPGPFTGLLLADAGASVLRIDRPTSSNIPTSDALTRHKTSLPLDLKHSHALSLFHSLLSKADVLIDPYRPGVLESLLSLTPASLCARYPRLILVRLTGYRREGKYSAMAGHDINYLAVSGVLSMLGEKGRPPLPPGNLLGDFAGGGAVAFMGILLALLERTRTGKGQIVEANMVDGAGYLNTFPRLALRTPLWNRPRGENMLDGGAPWYRCYATRDGGWMSVGALEDRFFAELCRLLGIRRGSEEWPGERAERGSWEGWRRVLEGRFKSRTRAEWEQLFEGTDACVAPVLEHGELKEEGFGMRPVVGLSASPLRAVARRKRGDEEDKEERTIADGQGAGVEGDGWVSKGLRVGEGGERTLREWMGWEAHKDYEVERGGYILRKDSGRAKL